MEVKKEKSNNPKYPNWNELKTRNFINLAAAVGIGVSAGALTLDMDADDNNVSEEKKTEDTDKKIKDEIILLTANLGHKDFNERDKSTKILICLGEKFNKEKKMILTEFLKSELEKCKKSEDPEIKDRAKIILLAITPPPPKTPNYNVKGIVAPPGW